MKLFQLIFIYAFLVLICNSGKKDSLVKYGSDLDMISNMDLEFSNKRLIDSLFHEKKLILTEAHLMSKQE